MSSGIHGDRLARFMASGAAAQPAAAALIGERRTFPAGDAVAGWLEKFGGAHTGRGRGWQRRWFVLSGVNLLYFASPADAKSKGSFDLSGAVVGAAVGDNRSIEVSWGMGGLDGAHGEYLSPFLRAAFLAGYDVWSSRRRHYGPGADASPAGAALLLHGCSNSGEVWATGAEEQVLVRELHERGLFLVAPTARDARALFGGSDAHATGCWDTQDAGEDNADLVMCAAVARWLMERHRELATQGGRAGAPFRLYAVGASSGGAFATLLAGYLQLNGLAVYIMDMHKQLPSLLPPVKNAPKPRAGAGGAGGAVAVAADDDAGSAGAGAPEAAQAGWYDSGKPWSGDGALLWPERVRKLVLPDGMVPGEMRPRVFPPRVALASMPRDEWTESSIAHSASAARARDSSRTRLTSAAALDLISESSAVAALSALAWALLRASARFASAVEDHVLNAALSLV